MNSHPLKSFVRGSLILTAVAGGVPSSAPAQAIPEPGLVMYGTVTNANGLMPVLQGTVQWTAAGGGSSAITNSLIVNVNGQYFYIARIPFETRSVSGGTFTPTPNTLPLTAATTSFTRSARVLGTNATVVSPALPSFNFGLADRGRVERVDLMVNLAVDPAADSDGDGVPNWAEQIAGTNPFDANSVFKVAADIQPGVGGGLTLRWSSVSGKAYAVYRSTDLGAGFIRLANNLPATAPLNQYTDSTAAGSGPYFYRVQVE